jgi:hypothetical protein
MDNAATVAGRISRRGFFAGGAFAAVAALAAAPILWLGAPNANQSSESAAVDTLEAEVQKLVKANADLILEEPGPALHVVVVHARFMDMPEARRNIAAREIARFMMWNYGGSRRVRGFVVEFAKPNLFGTYDVNETAWYSFTRFHLR